MIEEVFNSEFTEQPPEDPERRSEFSPNAKED